MTHFITTPADKMAAARRLIRAATGDAYGDGEIVTDMGVGIAEPGYGDEDTVWVAGNWNTKRFVGVDDPPLTNAESIGPRLYAALERIGVEGLWLDEWTRCGSDDCAHSIMRCQPDSYCWTPQYLTNRTGEDICLTCVRADLDRWLRDLGYVNDPKMAIPDTISVDEMIEAGWEWLGEHYQDGWYRRHDQPADIAKELRERHGENTEIVFRYSSQQFAIDFGAFIRQPETEEDDQ